MTEVQIEQEENDEKLSSKGELMELLVRTDGTGEMTRKKTSRYKKEQLTKGNMAVVKELILSQEIQPGAHYSKREITNLTDIPKSSVDGIANIDLDLQGYSKVKRQKLSEID